MPSTSGTEASFWCHACSRLRRPRAQGEPVAGCTRCGSPAAALEAIVDVVDSGAFVHACHPDAGLRTPAPSLPTATIRAAGRDCAVCMEELKPGATAAVTPCEHVYHPDCVAPWLQARGTCPLCRAPVVSGAGAGDHDGLVTCRFPGSGRIGLGRRIAGRIHMVRMLDEGGKLVRPRVLQRGFKGLWMTLGALVRRDLDVLPDVV